MELLKPLTLAAVLAPLLTPNAEPLQSAQDDKLLTASQLRLEHYMPQFAPAEHLAELAYNMAGVEREVQTGNGGETRFINNLFTFGDSVLLYDTPDAVTRLEELLSNLDQSYAMTAELPQVERIPVRYLSADQASYLLNNLYPGEYRFLTMENTVLLKGLSADVQRAAELLQSFDKPTPQVLISCHLIRGKSEGATDTRVPAELASHLSSLLPYESFELYSQAVLRSAAYPENGYIELWMEPEDVSPHGVLSMRPGGFEPDSGTLTLDLCQFSMGYPGEPTKDVFTTSTAVKTGEFTVLGATGMTPMFVVLRVDLL